MESTQLASYRDGIAELGAREQLARAPGDKAEAAVIEAIQNLGYTGAGGDAVGLPPPLEEIDRPSPSAMVKVYRMLQYAQDLSNRGEGAEAVRLFRQVLDENPDNPSAWFQLGATQILIEEYEASIVSSNAALAKGHDWYGPHKNIGLANDYLQRPEEALAAYERALETAPLMIEVLGRCAAMCEVLKLDDKANAYRVRLIQAREAELARE